MGKHLIKAAVLLVSLSAFLGCTSMQWVAEAREPADAGLAEVKTIGVLPFQTNVEANRRLIISVGGKQMPMAVEGISNKVNVEVTAPEALRNFALTEEKLGGMARDIWCSMLKGEEEYDYLLTKGFKPARVMSRSLEGQSLDPRYAEVVAIPESLSRKETTPGKIQELAGKYGVDAIIIGETDIYGDILRVLDVQKDDASFTDQYISPGTFVLNLDAYYEYQIFSGKDGSRIADSREMDLEYTYMIPEEDRNLQLSGVAGNKQELNAFLRSGEYAKLVTPVMKKATASFIPYLTNHYFAVAEKVEKE